MLASNLFVFVVPSPAALNQTGLHEIHRLLVTLLISVTIVLLRITENLNDRHKELVLLNQISFRP